MTYTAIASYLDGEVDQSLSYKVIICNKICSTDNYSEIP